MNERLSLKLSHNPHQAGSLLRNPRFLHAVLSVFTIEEVEDGIEGLLGIIRHVSERPSLAVLKKIVPCNAHASHCRLQSGGISTPVIHMLCRDKYANC
jgi:hypothetical protein